MVKLQSVKTKYGEKFSIHLSKDVVKVLGLKTKDELIISNLDPILGVTFKRLNLQ